jgi:DNA-binding response OmpR family regulator
MPRHAGRRILVVEDDAAVRVPLVKFLRLHGFDVGWAETTDGALDQMARVPPAAAVVDLRLRHGSGREVVMSLPLSTPVIIFSGAPDKSGLEHDRPNTRLVMKPFSLVLLVEILEELLSVPSR